MTKPRPILPRALFTQSSAGTFQRPSGRAGLALALAKNRILGQRSIYLSAGRIEDRDKNYRIPVRRVHNLRGAVGKSGLCFLSPKRRAGLYITGRGVGKDPAALGLSPRALKLPEMHPECRIFSVLLFLFFLFDCPRGEAF